MGRVFKAYYTKPGVVDAAGKPARFVTKGFSIEYTDAAGRTLRRKGGKNEADAKDALRKAEADVLRERNGLPTQKSGEIACTDLLARYITSLKCRATAAHCRDTEARLVALLSAVRAFRVKLACIRWACWGRGSMANA